MGKLRSKWNLGFLVSVAAMVALVVVAVSQSNSTATELEELREEVSRVKSGRAGTRTVERVIRIEQAAPEETHEASDAASPRRDLPELTPEEGEHRGLVESEAQAELCLQSHAAEAPDPQWSASAAQTIRETYSGEAFEALSVSVDCRSTLCRMGFEYTDPALGMEAVHAMVSKAPWSGYRFTRFDQETQQGVSYIAREGFDIPSVDPDTLTY